MKTCTSCQTMNPDSAAICKQCGEVLPVSSEWQDKLRQNVQTDKQPPRPEVHKPAPSKAPTATPAAWSPALAAAGLLLVSAFVVAGPNAGLVLTLGGAISIAGLFRGVSERHEVAITTAAIALGVFVLTSLLRLM